MKKHNNIFIKKILLAAGSSKRYGDKNKLTEKFKGKYLIQHIRDTLLKVFDPCELLIVLGYDAKVIKDLINKGGQVLYLLPEISITSQMVTRFNNFSFTHYMYFIRF